MHSFWKTVPSYLRALVFLLLRLRRRTRFFLHLALIFGQINCNRLLASAQEWSLAYRRPEPTTRRGVSYIWRG